MFQRRVDIARGASHEVKMPRANCQQAPAAGTGEQDRLSADFGNYGCSISSEQCCCDAFKGGILQAA